MKPKRKPTTARKRYASWVRAQYMRVLSDYLCDEYRAEIGAKIELEVRYWARAARSVGAR